MDILTDINTLNNERLVEIRLKQGDVRGLVKAVIDLREGHDEVDIRAYATKTAAKYQGWWARVHWKNGWKQARIQYQSEAVIHDRKRAVQDLKR